MAQFAMITFRRKATSSPRHDGPEVKPPPYRADWVSAVRTTFGLALVGSMLLCVIALVTSLSAANGSEPFAAWSVLGDWGRSSAAHMGWTAPALLAAVGILASLPGVISRTEPGDSEATQTIVTFLAHLLAAAFCTWMVLVVAGLTSAPRSSTLVDAATIDEQRGAIAGLFLVAPLGVFFGLAAGRFLLPAPHKQIADIERRLETLSAEVTELTNRAYTEWRRARTLVVLWLTQAVPLTILLIVVIWVCSAARLAPGDTFTICLLVTLMYALSAIGTVLIRLVMNRPTGLFWRQDEERGRRARVLAVTVFIVAGVLILMPTAFAVVAFILPWIEGSAGWPIPVILLVASAL